MGFVLGAAVGAIVIGVIANRRPNWFANVVKAANAVDDKVNTAAAKVADQVKQ